MTSRLALFLTMIKPLAQIMSWLLLGLITALNLVSPALRPVTGAPHSVEHFGIFAITGAAFAVGYQVRITKLFLLATVYCAVLEIMQNLSPGRHARFSDFIIDSAGACAGIAFVMLIKRSLIAKIELGARKE